MSGLWEHTDRTACTHPGWASLHGWAQVAGSFFGLFQAMRSIQFVLTRESAHVQGDVGWVTLDENLLGDQGGQTVSALNLFARHGDGWLMIAHHGSAVSARMQA